MNRLGFNANGIAHFAQKNKPLIQRIQQRQFNVRAHDLERNAGKARTGAYVDNFRILFNFKRFQQRQAIYKMFYNCLFRVGDGREVHHGVALQKQIKINLELLRLCRRNLYANLFCF